MKQDITELHIAEDVKAVLNKNKIRTLKQLCNKTKLQLRNMNLTQTEVNQIEIQIQLLGLCLKNSL